jgi:hypothetical protein
MRAQCSREPRLYAPAAVGPNLFLLLLLNLVIYSITCHGGFGTVNCL